MIASRGPRVKILPQGGPPPGRPRTVTVNLFEVPQAPQLWTSPQVRTMAWGPLQLQDPQDPTKEITKKQCGQLRRRESCCVAMLTQGLRGGAAEQKMRSLNNR